MVLYHRCRGKKTSVHQYYY